MEYQVALTQQDVQLVFQAIGELPLKVTLDLFNRLAAQVQAQDEANAIQLAD